MKIIFRVGFLICFSSFLLLIGLFGSKPVFAQFCETSGWAWSDFAGWVAFSCEDYPPDPIACGGDPTDPVDYCCDKGNWPLYGVKIQNESDGGGFYDYAWNDNAGWIDFGPIATSPDGTVNPATLDFSILPPNPKEVNGWARIDAYAGAPDEGWISMSCETDPNIINKAECDPGGTYENYKVTYQNCQFHGWAWSDDIGWISFNCDTDTTVDCDDYWGSTKIGDVYNVSCGAKLPAFKLTDVSINGNSPCSQIDLKWEKKGEGLTGYYVYRNGIVINQDDPLDPASCSETSCQYRDNQNLDPETSYTYKIRAVGGCGYRDSDDPVPASANTAHTTICPPVLFIDQEQCCQQQKIFLNWTGSEGAGGSEGADGYIIYQTIGGDTTGEGYKKTVTSSIYDSGDDSYTWDDEPILPGSPPIFCSSGCLPGADYCWCSPEDTDPFIEEDEDPFVFKPNTHYYYFVRALDYDLENVDSNQVEICCQQ